MDRDRLNIQPWTVTRTLILITAILTLASIAGQIAKLGWGIERAGGLIPGFDLDGEGNFPTWYQSASLGLCAGLLALAAAVARSRGERGAWRWHLLALIFLGFSIDEITSVHEMLGELLRRRFHLSNWLYQAWVIPGALFVVLVAVAYRRFLMELPPKIRRLFIVAAMLYVGGAMGVEIVGGHFVSDLGVEHWSWAVLTTLEECLEMAGVIVFIHALLTHLGQREASFYIRKT